MDSLVKLINNSNFKTQRDTIKQDRPDYGISSRTYLTMVSEGNELKKYVNSFHMTTKNNGISKKMDGENAFYFDHNKLIKVEEFMSEGDKKMEMHWYYADEKPIYNTLNAGKDNERAEMLLKMAKGLVEKMSSFIK
ncbi:hypothetical protein FAM09_05030 [Niastella caeni]|uniref:Uncharacterized protein n=1 Tax=Niastella caeni TaxID=2569763 RepID=A0A4S8I061_9BACT|nr:hypothetical protein [Niastella caeni]THU41473.1 hypothetical protein FAM09_05030 [Niastella caeni]